MDKIKRNNAIYIAFLSISIAIMAVIIIIPMVQSMRYVRHTVDYNSIVAMGSYHIKISNATYLKDKKELYFALSAKEEYNVPLVKTQMKKIIVTAKTLYSHPKNVSKIYAALHTDLAW